MATHHHHHPTTTTLFPFGLGPSPWSTLRLRPSSLLLAVHLVSLSPYASLPYDYEEISMKFEVHDEVSARGAQVCDFAVIVRVLP